MTTENNIKAQSKGYDLSKALTYKERLQIHIDNSASVVSYWNETQEQAAYTQALNWLKQA